MDRHRHGIIHTQSQLASAARRGLTYVYIINHTAGGALSTTPTAMHSVGMVTHRIVAHARARHNLPGKLTAPLIGRSTRRVATVLAVVAPAHTHTNVYIIGPSPTNIIGHITP